MPNDVIEEANEQLAQSFEAVFGMRPEEMLPEFRVGTGKATHGDWVRLKGSVAWQDYLEGCRKIVEDAKESLITCPIAQIPVFRGAIFAMREMLNLAEQATLDETEEEERDGSTGRNTAAN